MDLEDRFVLPFLEGEALEVLWSLEGEAFEALSSLTRAAMIFEKLLTLSLEGHSAESLMSEHGGLMLLSSRVVNSFRERLDLAD